MQNSDHMKLRECPFCGSVKLKIEHKSKNVGYNGSSHHVKQCTYSIRCNKCHARGPAYGGKIMPYNALFFAGEIPLPNWATTEDALTHKAIEAWNRRAGNG